MTKPKVLLLTDVLPCDNYSGGLSNQRLCWFLLEEKCQVVCAHLQAEDLREKVDDVIRQKIKIITYKKPLENTTNQASYKAEADRLATEILRIVEQEQIDVVWAPIQGQTILRILRKIQMSNRKIRVVPQIWDPIEWGIESLKYPKTTADEIKKLYDDVLDQADFILTASKPMTNAYGKKYRAKNAPIYCSYDFEAMAKKAKKASDQFVIVFSGQTYAKRAMQAFVAALDRMNWQCDGKEIVLKYFGNNRDEFLCKNPHIKLCGYVSQEVLIEEEHKADLLYCPYFLDNPKLAIVSQQSYPSKVVTYIPAGTPILVHAAEDSSIYQDFKEHDCGFLLASLDEKEIAQNMQAIVKSSTAERQRLVNNANKMAKEKFSTMANKKIFMDALGIKYVLGKRYHILEVNNLDLPGKRWNGYDLMNYFNQKPEYNVNQICTYKTSHNDDVVKIYNESEQELEYRLLSFEAENLSVHSCLSAASPILLEKNVFKNADLVHLHLIHNMKLSLISLVEICNKKPTVITIHDPWIFTGHCVYMEDCPKYMTGCKKCPDLNRLFPLKCDTCHELWQLKKKVYEKLDIDFVVTTKYMYDLCQNSPLTKGKRVHLIPFGMNIDEFTTVSQKVARQKYDIPQDNIVLFHRAQLASKGTSYLVEALEEIDVPQSITLITCNETGHFKSVEKKIQVIELGDVDSSELAYAYNACDMYIMPSTGESFGMMAIEAMSCAKPVIVFNNSALPSVTFAPECGIAVENLNSHKLMEAIKWMIEDEDERQRRGKLGRKLVEENYRLDIYHQKIEELYREAMSRKHNNNGLKILEQNPQETLSTLALKTQLNKLTNELFPAKSHQRKKQLYDLPQNVNEDIPIVYSDWNVQLVINQYNNAVVKNWREFVNDDTHSTGWRKVRRKIKTFTRLLLYDRKKILKVIGEKVKGKKQNDDKE